MSLDVGSVAPSKLSSVFGIPKSRTGPNLTNMVDGPISISIFWPKTPGQRARHEQGHCNDARYKYQAKVQVFSNEEPHVTLPILPNNNAGSLFDWSLIFSAEPKTHACVTLPLLRYYCPICFTNTQDATTDTS
jgi:hypothetical protein